MAKHTQDYTAMADHLKVGGCWIIGVHCFGGLLFGVIGSLFGVTVLYDCFVPLCCTTILLRSFLTHVSHLLPRPPLPL